MRDRIVVFINLLEDLIVILQAIEDSLKKKRK